MAIYNRAKKDRIMREFFKDFNNMIIRIDSREQDNYVFTQLMKYKINCIGGKLEDGSYYKSKIKVDYGDFGISVPFLALDEKEVNLCYERKSSISEIIGNLTDDKDENGMTRLEREFYNATREGYRIRFVCESGSWNEIYNGAYRSAMKTNALVSKLKALESRYNAPLEFIDKKVITFDVAISFKMAVREFLFKNGANSHFKAIEDWNKKVRVYKKQSK